MRQLEPFDSMVAIDETSVTEVTNKNRTTGVQRTLIQTGQEKRKVKNGMECFKG